MPSTPSEFDADVQTLDSVTALNPPPVTGRLTRAWIAVGSHSSVDFLSFVPIALMPVLKAHASLTDTQVALTLATHAFASGAIQPAAAWVSDRFDHRIIGALGVVAAGLGIGGLSYATSFPMLIVLILLTAGGVGAYHPTGAAAVGSLAGKARGRWMSLFFVAGMLGGISGNVLSPRLERAIGLEGLLWLIVPATVVGMALWLAIRKVPHRAHGAHESHAALSEAQRRARWTSVGLLYAGSVIRFGVNNALIYLMISMLQQRVMAEVGATELTPEIAREASQLNGVMQAAMQVGMGGGGMLLGWFLAHRHQKAGLVLTPVLGASALSVIPLVSDQSIALFVVTVVAGVGFGSMIPVTLSLAQRLLPHRTSLASALMLGGAWMFAGTGALTAQRVEAAFGLQTAFWVVAGVLLLAGVISMGLPSKLLNELDH